MDKELIKEIIAFATPLLTLFGWFLTRHQNVFNTRKIQKYEAHEYQYNVILYQLISTIINPIICTLAFILSYAIFLQMAGSTYYYRLVLSIEIYIVIIIVFHVNKKEYLIKKRKKLDIISSSISEEAKLAILFINKKKNIFYNILVFNFYTSGIILLFIFSNNHFVERYFFMKY